jgi:hypothetical protein
MFFKGLTKSIVDTLENALRSTGCLINGYPKFANYNDLLSLDFLDRST